MFRLAWLTDLHLNFATHRAALDLFDAVRDSKVDAVAISGDVAEAHDVVSSLEQIDDALERPVYFVLGNHDFYFGSIRRVRGAMDELCRVRPRLTYLSHRRFVSLTPRLALVGHDGWADARVGDYFGSEVMLNDYRLIEELEPYDKEGRLPVLRELGDEAARHVRRGLRAALAGHGEALLVTHVPPLREACWHEGRISDDEWAPHFTCEAVGRALLSSMRRRPDRRLTVLCGHTHGAGVCRPLENVEIHTGGAQYGRPSICRIWEFDDGPSPAPNAD